MKWLGVLALAGLTGCGGLIPNLQTDPIAHNGDIVCIARYVQLTPDLRLGYDGCGNVWTYDENTDKCQIISSDGRSMIDITCPASGDTLSWIPGGTR